MGLLACAEVSSNELCRQLAYRAAGACNSFDVIRLLINNISILNRILKDQNQLLYDDTSLNFIRNTTQLIENKYPSANLVLEIQSSSTRLAGYLFCNYLRKMFIELYNTSPLLPNELSTRNQILPSKFFYHYFYDKSTAL